MQGKLIGERYRILDRLGEGGMAIVYIARDEKLGRKVAIKVLHQHFSENEDVRARFAMEATAISTMDHPNILKVYDFSGPHSKQLWIVTELLQGQNLSQFAKSFRNSCVNPIVSCFIVREILKALDHAHAADIVHRDIKPENVMVLRNGRIILMDFGIAKNMHKSSMTMTGTFMGSPSYMSPEQIRGKDVDARSDIYSLGILFYEILSGRLPYTGDSTHAVILKIMEGKYTAPRFLIPDLPEEIDYIVCHAIHKNPKNRFQNSQSFGEQLDIFIQKIGFVESHVELERYAQSPSAYMSQLLKMTKQSIRTGTIRTAHALTHKRTAVAPEELARANQNSILEPLPHHPEPTRMLDPTGTRRDRVIPKHKSLARPQHIPSTKIDQPSSVKTKPTAYLLKSPGLTHNLPHPQIPIPVRKRVRPHVPKRSQIAPQIILRGRMSVSHKSSKESPLFGMLVVLVGLIALLWGFKEFVITSSPEKKPVGQTQRVTPRTPKIPVNVQEKVEKTQPRLNQEPAPTVENNSKENRTPRVQKSNVKDNRSTRLPQAPARVDQNITITQPEPVVTQTPIARNTVPETITPPQTPSSQQQSEPLPEIKNTAKPAEKEEINPPASTAKATLLLSANIAARIMINSRSYGTTVDSTYHSRPIELTPGRYRIVLKHRAYKDLIINQELSAGQKLHLNNLVLTPKTIKIPLKVQTDRFPTKMTLKGRENQIFIRRDITRSNERILLDPGHYSLKMEYEDKTIEREVFIRENTEGFTININFSKL